jgi:hypothetical protein
MSKLTARQKRFASESVRRLGLSRRSLYRKRGGFELLKTPPFRIKKIAGGYVVVVAEQPPPSSEFTLEDLESDDTRHPAEFCGGLYAELISLAEKRVAGTCEGKVYYFPDMVCFFEPEDIVEGFDDEDVDCAAAAIELRRRKQLRPLLTIGAADNVLHLMRLGVARRHRGHALGWR